jgi:hypothetical protein
MEPKLIVKSTPLELELSELLGGETADFIVICANGEQVPFLGTPYDHPVRRAAYPELIAKLNDRSGTDWPEMFVNWKRQFCAHYKLAPETTAQDFWPEFSFAISRTCPGYAQHLHVAVRLFEQLGPKVTGWLISHGDGKDIVEIFAANGAVYRESGEGMALVIATAVKRLLTDFKAKAA